MNERPSNPAGRWRTRPDFVRPNPLANGPSADRVPQAPRASMTLTPQSPRLSGGHLQSWVRESNSLPATRPNALTSRLGAGVRSVDPARTNGNFARLENSLGRPGHHFDFHPRGGRFDEFGRNGHEHGWYGRHDRDDFDDFVGIDLFFPFYFDDPFWFGFDYPGYYPSVYSYWGWTPGWIYPSQVYYDPNDTVYVPSTPDSSNSVYRYYQPIYRPNPAGAEQAISDLRHAWLEGDISLFSSHLDDGSDLRIYFDGSYAYTTSVKDFYAMTADALATTKTISIGFDDPIWISPAEVFYTGSQRFTDPDGAEHTVYLSYRLRHLGSDWYVVAVGSSEHPIESHYTDYRG